MSGRARIGNEARRRRYRCVARDLGKPRPAVVVQIDLLNLHLGTILLCQFSSFSSNPSLFRVAVEPSAQNGLRKRSEIMVDNTQSVSGAKVRQVIGRLAEDHIQRMDRSLMTVLGLVPTSRQEA